MHPDLLELLGEDAMTPKARARVVEQIGKLWISRPMRRALLLRWARTVGVELTDEDFALVSSGPFHEHGSST